MSGLAPPSSSIRPFSDRGHWVLLGIRMLVVADVTRLLLRRWNAFDASLRMLEREGFPAPELWLSTALIAGGVGITMLLVGERTRLGAGIVLLFFLPLAYIFSVSYMPTGWPPWIAPALPLLAMLEDLLLGFALMGLFFFGAGRYTLTWALDTLRHPYAVLKRKISGRNVSTTPKKQLQQS